MNSIKRGKVTQSAVDIYAQPKVQIKTLNGVRFAEPLFHYGAFGVAPLGSMAVSFNIGGEESNQSAIVYSPALRPANLAPGEYVCGNFLHKNYLYFKDDGSVILTTPNGATIEVDSGGVVNVTATHVNINSKCTLGEGGKGVARLGDSVQVDIATGKGIITSASENHDAD
jgi:phage gp45-like